MKGRSHIFHLAIPCANLDQAASFYTQLGAGVARRYDDRITLNFFGDQVVCHLAPESIDRQPKMYPRHFGLTFGRREDFDQVYTRAQEGGLSFFADVQVRFQGLNEEHLTFFLKDPSNNLLEFKYYYNSEMMF